MQERIKILILTDGQKWIVDRITDEMIKRIPHDFTKVNYTDVEDFVDKANSHDIAHFQNWDLKDQIEVLDRVKKPILITIRSHRFPEYIKEVKAHFHTITPDIQKKFPNSTMIPDGIFIPQHREFTVGFAGVKCKYKGNEMIEQACKELGVKFKPVKDIPADKMGEYYESIDLYVCASENEGHSTPVMECISINKPVITTDVGIPKMLNVTKIERSIEGIKEGIGKFYTQEQVKDYTWENTCKQFKELYETIAGWRSTKD